MLSLYDNPVWVEDLLELCTQVEIAFALAQIEAGAQLIGLGDAIASLLSTQMYLKYALPYEQRIFQAVHAAGAAARLHICGKTTRLLPYMAQSGADIIDLDWMVDLGAAAHSFAGQAAACGNFDPVAIMLQGTPDQVYSATLECHASGGERWFSAAGCEIPESTPHALKMLAVDYNLHKKIRIPPAMWIWGRFLDYRQYLKTDPCNCCN